MNRPPIFVTRPELPPLDEFIPYLRQIWDSRILTNGGPFHQQLESALCEYLGVEHLSLFANGTVALIASLQALRITGEVITTPFSFVATAHAILLSGLTPVFVDIEPDTLNLDPNCIEAAITARTRAIMPVHCYGNPCAVRAIDEVADRHELKVIYDAAHAFGVRYAGESVLRHGNASVLSFHATKVFNTFEGGAIVCRDAAMKARIDQLKNFGYVSETQVTELGINGKMSEFNAALGLLQLKHIDRAIDRRKLLDQAYRERLDGIAGVRCLPVAGDEVGNYSYFPVLVGPDYPVSRDELHEILKSHGIHCRRYFYPLIASFPMYEHLRSASPDNLPIAAAAAQQILCLPIYPSLDASVVDVVTRIIAAS